MPPFSFSFFEEGRRRRRRKKFTERRVHDNKLREWTVMRRVRRYNERINPFLPRSITKREGGGERNKINRVYTRRKVRADRK